MENVNINHVALNMDPLTISNVDNQLNELCDLILTPKCEVEDDGSITYEDHLNKIRDILSESATTIFEANIEGKNIFHIVADSPDRSSEVLQLFTFYLDGNNAAASNLLSQGQAERLLYAQDEITEFTPVHLAVKNGFNEFLREVLRRLPSLLSARDGSENTPLHLAAQSSMPESLECMRTILDIVERNDLSEEILLNTRNADGYTLVHSLCLKVPKNKGAPVVEKLKLLLRHECTKDILNIEGVTKSPLHLLCWKGHQHEDPDTNLNLREILVILSKRPGVNNPTKDSDQRTALHLLAISECVTLVDILLSSSAELDLTIKDGHGRMAIHYAAEKADRPNSEKIAMKLGNWPTFSKIMKSKKSSRELQDSFRNYLLWDTYVDDNQEMNTALTACCKAPSPETVQFFLENLYQAKNNFGIWFRDKGPDAAAEIFSLKKVYENAPAALEFLFDRSIKVDMKKSTKSCVEFISDISVITALDKPVQKDKVSSEVEYLRYAEDWPDELQNKILLHPLTQSALFVMWEQMLYYRILWTIMNMLWLLAYFLLLPLKLSPNVPEQPESLPMTQIFAAWTLAVLSLLCLVYYMYETLAMMKRKSKSAFGLVKARFFNWLQIILAGVVVYGVLFVQEGRLTALHVNCAAAGVSLSFLVFGLNLGVVSLYIGLKIEYFRQTVKKILQTILYVIPAVIGFLLAFQQILPGYFSGSFSWSLIKMVVMMTGEYDFGEMYDEYKKEISDNSSNATEANGGTGGIIDLSNIIVFAIFLVFLFFISISFYNLVTAVSVDKIQAMKRKLEINQIICQLKLINYVQQTMISVLDHFTLCLHCSRGLLPSYISFRSKDGGVILDQQLKFYIQKDIGSKIMKRRKGSSLTSPDAICANGLPKSVKEKIFKLYQEKLNALDE